MKRYLFGIMFLIGNYSTMAQRIQSIDSFFYEPKQLSKIQVMKDYFLCKCISRGIGSNIVDSIDASHLAYVETLNWNSLVLSKIDSLADRVVRVIRSPTLVKYESHPKGKYNIIGMCQEASQSKTLDKILKGFQYKYASW